MKNWQTIALTLFASLVVSGGVLTAVALAVIQPQATSPITTPITTTEKPLLTRINALRAEKGVSPLTASPELQKSAQEKADDMATRHYFGHISPDGVKGWTLISKYLDPTTRRSENLTVCVDNDNTAGAFKAWLNSPAHYQGMIDPAVTLYGEGKAWDSEKHCTVYVNHFAAV